jgi:hypothetical protein
MAVSDTEQLVAEALQAQSLEELSGFAESNPALARLATAPDLDQLLREVQYLRSGDQPGRQLHARILAECHLSPQRRIDELRRVLSDEPDPKVIRWIVIGFRNAASASALPDLHSLAHHASADVRFPVPDALSACATSFDDVAHALLELSRDQDPDVRWSAAFELGAWWADTKDPRIRRRLSALRTDDESQEVRNAAADALSGGEER